MVRKEWFGSWSWKRIARKVLHGMRTVEMLGGVHTKLWVKFGVPMRSGGPDLDKSSFERWFGLDCTSDG